MSGATQLRLDWPLDLALTVASHGWAYLAPWQWDPEQRRLARPERSGGGPGEIAVTQSDPNSLDVVWEGFDAARDAGEILRRVGRWISAEWDPSPATAATSKRCR